MRGNYLRLRFRRLEFQSQLFLQCGEQRRDLVCRFPRQLWASPVLQRDFEVALQPGSVRDRLAHGRHQPGRANESASRMPPA
jgi:hypothetical protein